MGGRVFRKERLVLRCHLKTIRTVAPLRLPNRSYPQLHGAVLADASPTAKLWRESQELKVDPEKLKRLGQEEKAQLWAALQENVKEKWRWMDPPSYVKDPVAYKSSLNIKGLGGTYGTWLTCLEESFLRAYEVPRNQWRKHQGRACPRRLRSKQVFDRYDLVRPVCC